MRRLSGAARDDVRPVGSAPGAPPSTPPAVYRAERVRLERLLVEMLARTPLRLAHTVADALPRLREAREITLHVHPQDRALLPSPAALRETHALRGALTLVEDASLTRGGCRIVAAEGELDARVETQVALLLSAAEAQT